MSRVATWATALGFLALFVGLVWAWPYDRNRHGVGIPATDTSPIGTTGHDSVLEPEDSPATLHDLETLTGAVDPHELVGQRVDFHVRVRDVDDETSFWIGSKDNRILVVHNRIEPLEAGGAARVIGSIQWRDRDPYIRADNVIPEG